MRQERGLEISEDDIRLSKSIRHYIRDLKKDGKYDEAVELGRKLRQEKLQRKIRNTVGTELKITLANLSEEPNINDEIKAILLLNREGVIEDRNAAMQEIRDKIDTLPASGRILKHEEFQEIKEEVEKLSS